MAARLWSGRNSQYDIPPLIAAHGKMQTKYAQNIRQVLRLLTLQAVPILAGLGAVIGAP
jgi:hypothetical protein